MTGGVFYIPKKKELGFTLHLFFVNVPEKMYIGEQKELLCGNL